MRFPSGLPALIEWLHTRKFKFGLYIDAGNVTCRPRYNRSIVGSLGHYETDAATFARWQVDYVKMDWCGTQEYCFEKFPGSKGCNEARHSSCSPPAVPSPSHLPASHLPSPSHLRPFLQALVRQMSAALNATMGDGLLPVA